MTEPRTPERGHPTNWVELREYVEARMEDMKRHYDFRLNNTEAVRQRAADDLDKRLVALDEAQRTKYPTRDDIRQIADAFASDIRMLRESHAAQQGKASIGSFYVTLIIALAGLTLAVFEVFKP
jgi:tRNA U38,U39,U40 pseudouridine synthase TruA